MSLSWIEALVAAHEEIIVCERRFYCQCALVVERVAEGHDTTRDEMLLASYMTSLDLLRAQRDSFLMEVPLGA